MVRPLGDVVAAVQDGLPGDRLGYPRHPGRADRPGAGGEPHRVRSGLHPQQDRGQGGPREARRGDAKHRHGRWRAGRFLVAARLRRRRRRRGQPDAAAGRARGLAGRHRGRRGPAAPARLAPAHPREGPSLQAVPRREAGGPWPGPVGRQRRAGRRRRRLLGGGPPGAQQAPAGGHDRLAPPRRQRRPRRLAVRPPPGRPGPESARQRPHGPTSLVLRQRGPTAAGDAQGHHNARRAPPERGLDAGHRQVRPVLHLRDSRQAQHKVHFAHRRQRLEPCVESRGRDPGVHLRRHPAVHCLQLEHDEGLCAGQGVAVHLAVLPERL
mmetsp:Transcript_6003/g.18617  ORF Transcript_6003/g.18617 Transcript_6003/m.18617 type:complete len:324 (+) Transcript_6003:821-1792(+)